MEEKVRSQDVILDAIRELHNHEQLVTRETLAEVTGLRLSTIDDRLKYLVDNDLILRIQRGVYIPVVHYPPSRPISLTLLSDGGTMVLEIGDRIVHLTPREARHLSKMLCGTMLDYSSISAGHEITRMNSEIQRRIDRLEVPGLCKRDDNQGDLFEQAARLDGRPQADTETSAIDATP